MEYQYAQFSKHRAISVEGMWAVEDELNPQVSPEEFFANPWRVSAVFTDVSRFIKDAGSATDPHLLIIHCGKTDTNSKLPNLHVHMKLGDFPPPHEHIAVQKTFVPMPRAGIAAYIRMQVAEAADTQSPGLLFALPDEVKEAPLHTVLAFPGFANVCDFGEQATDVVFQFLSRCLAPILKEYGTDDKGVRLVIDGMVNPTSCFTIHALAGGPLWQGSKPHRWFEKPEAPTPPSP